MRYTPFCGNCVIAFTLMHKVYELFRFLSFLGVYEVSGWGIVSVLVEAESGRNSFLGCFPLNLPRGGGFHLLLALTVRKGHHHKNT